MSTAAALVVHQFRYDQKMFWRRPAAVFFTVALPLIFLFIFATIFGNETIDVRGGIKTTTYYVPAIIALSVISATMVSPAIAITQQRESGVLKRVRGTPLPSWVFIAGRVGNALVVSVLMVILVTIIGRLVYGVAIPTTTIPAILITLLVGAASFACMGFALTTIIPSEEAAPAITNAIALPLYFISGIFIPDSEIPDGVLSVADIFPIRHFFEAFFAAWDPSTSGAGIELGHLAVVAAWGALGLAVAVWRFRWAPHDE
ncbi:MAG: ABC transporter permease [Solirubrobacterales bacterium]